MSIEIASPEQLPEAVGRSATGEWFAVEQDRIDRFAEVTEDHQWIHTDPVQAAAGPFGATVAHGYLTLSLLPRLVAGLVEVKGVSMIVNYGLDRVRFVTPVSVGSRVRAHTTIVSAEPGSRGTRLTSDVEVQVEGGDRPAIVARSISLVVPSP
ncbi:MaoC family dehydratase [Kineosporia rhizophila]|uniref:MaoC family dehydratase n=1 Tax=Kineosporia TaxID=49184 RepID=UPI000AA42095|nr:MULTISPECIES: MaoC family dehydratase [Kineosporia]MCE0536393.1 MaoC family dehydratase [Kineosporia rhizophila]GLY15515.1 dehydratase [Kineosporia sp. NBRC 101677]